MQPSQNQRNTSKQQVIEHNFIETVSTNNISVQRGDGARGDNGVNKNKH